MDDDKRRVDNAARAELRRLVSDGLPPTDTPPDAFGPWAEYVEPLRAAHPRGVEAVRRAFVALANMEPTLGRLLSSDPEPEPEWFSTAQVLDANVPPLEWIVPDILPVGLATLAGRPKQGKSWLALQMAVAVGSGGRFLDRRVERRKVLYIALEDGIRRLQDRLRALGTPYDCDACYAVQWPALDKAGLNRLESAIQRGGFRLVIVDTLSRALDKADQLDLAQMNGIIGELHDLTKRTGCAILTIDHHRKPSGLAYNDAIDDIMGSTGKAAIVDVAIGWYRDKNKREALLKATGRDILDIELATAWDGALHQWQLLGEAAAVHKENVRTAILDAIRDLEALGELPSTKNIARHVERSMSNVSHGLNELMNANLVYKGAKVGRAVPYRLVEQAPPPT